MFGARKRHRMRLEAAGTDSGAAPVKRDRVGRAMFTFLGPASVEGALQGHSPQARAAWKRQLENNRRIREEAKGRRKSGESPTGF